MSEFDEKDREDSKYWDDERITGIPNPLEKLRKKKRLSGMEKQNMDTLIAFGIDKERILNLIPFQKISNASKYYDTRI